MVRCEECDLVQRGLGETCGDGDKACSDGAGISKIAGMGTGLSPHVTSADAMQCKGIYIRNLWISA